MDSQEQNLLLLNELIRRVSNILSPDTYLDNVSAIIKKQVRNRLFGAYPKCFLKARNVWGQELPIMPICNRMGIEDPQMISFSLKVANTMKDSPNIDQDHLKELVVKLIKLQNKFSKPIPKPDEMAVKKALTTKLISKVKNYLSSLHKERE
jgi:hypothetical protein